MSMTLDDAIGGIGVSVNDHQDGHAFAGAVVAKKLEVIRKWGEDGGAETGELEAAYFLQGYMWVTMGVEYGSRFREYWEKHHARPEPQPEWREVDASQILLDSTLHCDHIEENRSGIRAVHVWTQGWRGSTAIRRHLRIRPPKDHKLRVEERTEGDDE